MSLPRALGGFHLLRGRLLLLAALVLACFGSVALGLADPFQDPLPPPRPVLGPPEVTEQRSEQLPSAPERPARPATGPGSVGEFVEGLTRNDAGFEVLLGQGRILATRMDLAAKGKASPLIAIGDPTVADFSVVNNRQVRIEGRRIGVTDLSIVTADGQVYSFEVRVVADLPVLRGQLHALFPGAAIRLSQVRDSVVVEGEARDAVQVARIIETVQAYLISVRALQDRRALTQQRLPAAPAPEPAPKKEVPPGDPDMPGTATAEQPPRSAQATVPPPRVINLLRVPGTKQVMLKVRVAELNRTAFRQIGTDLLFRGANGTAGTRIGGATVNAGAEGTREGTRGVLGGFAQLLTGGSTTAFGIFEKADFAFLMSALRRNSLLKVLAEPNLVAMNGQAANFLAGGEFPVPVPQVGASGVAPTITVQFKEFGVRLGFLPTILDGETIRLAVDPEVSTIDRSLGTILVPGGSPVPGLNTRRVHTVVEMREGQTLAIAGLLQVTLDAQTQRIPGLGDLPVIGPLFSNTTNERVEKELIVLVTPYLIDPMHCDELPPSPGDEVTTPSDFEFYFLNRIEGRTGREWRSTTQYEKQLPAVRALLRLDAAHVAGPYGFCD
jgi:pilus assembly protein CpaC